MLNKVGRYRIFFVFALALSVIAVNGALFSQAAPTVPAAPSVIVKWEKTIIPNHTVPTLQAVINPMLQRGSPIHDAALEALHKLGADYVRYAFWFPYPKMAVAELRPPEGDQTFWDFQYMDPLVDDFLRASEGHSSVFSFSTIPQWMFTTVKPIVYPDDPNQVFWDYTQGTELTNVQAMADYYARLAGWYTQGGFTDELGKFHASGHHFDIRYWEVFNEIDGEHDTRPQQYVNRYDAVTQAVLKVAPQMKFVALALSNPSEAPRMFSYFLDARNHRAGVPLDYISFHFYATPTGDQTLDDWQYTFFDQAAEFLAVTRYILEIRDRQSPLTKVMVNEAGSILAGDMVQGEPGHVEKPIPAAYWNLSAALYGYLYIELAKLGIDSVGESQLVGYPSQFPSVSMIDWTNGKPNARFTVLQLLKNNFGPGDDLTDTTIRSNGSLAESDALDAQAFVRDGHRKLVLINERNREVTVELPKECLGAVMQSIGGASPDVVKQKVGEAKVSLQPFSVSVIALND
ncbi:MAG: glycosyl hydrolase family 39 [Candidatus Sulfotelmatobacter sp.]